MYSISEISRLTGITAFTLRYYEKIGLLPKPRRLDGKQTGARRYDDRDLRFIRFIHGLKQTGMKLEDIVSFTKDGCLLQQEDPAAGGMQEILRKRIEMLDQHIDELQQRMKQLHDVKETANEKRSFYSAMLKEQMSRAENEV